MKIGDRGPFSVGLISVRPWARHESRPNATCDSAERWRGHPSGACAAACSRESEPFQNKLFHRATLRRRGNHRADVFFEPEHRDIYLAMLEEHCRRSGVHLWAYCLMTNHVHLIVEPQDEKSLGVGARTRAWQVRAMGQCVLWVERAPLVGVRYVELNPVRARLVERAETWRWSSAEAHGQGSAVGDALLDSGGPFLNGRVSDWLEWLAAGIGEQAMARSHVPPTL